MHPTKRETMVSPEDQSAGRTAASYPLRLYAEHMAEIFGVELYTFFRLESAGAFVQFEHRPRIGQKTWSRDRVSDYLVGTRTTT